MRGIRTSSIYSAGASCTVSSKQFKHDIESLTETSGLEAVAELRAVSFVYNDDIGVPGDQVGFIAEEVLDVDPRLVVFDADGKPRGVKYENLTALLAKSIQELDARTSILAEATAPIDDAEESLWDRLMTLAGSFVDDVLTVTGVRVEYVRSDYLESQQLCLTDNDGSTCVDRAQLRTLLENAQLNPEQDIENEDDAEVSDVDAGNEGAGDTDFDLGNSATSTDEVIATDTLESIAIIPPTAIPQAATSLLGQ